MTPKEKAKELEDKFIGYCNGSSVDHGRGQRKNAKQCALIAVDEIMNMDVWDNPMDEIHYGLIFWKQVKEEINKL